MVERGAEEGKLLAVGGREGEGGGGRGRHQKLGAS